MRLSVDFYVTENGKKSPKYDIDTDLSGEISLVEMLNLMKNTLVLVAIDATKDEQSRGFDKNPVVIVDNKRNKPIETVDPFGKIEVHSRIDTSKVFMELYENLLKLSPVKTGQYKDHHIVIVNGVEIARNQLELSSWLTTNNFKDRDVVRFVNAMPYAGFLERHGSTSMGITNQKLIKSTDKRKRAADSAGMVRRPNGTYFITARSFKRKYKGNSFISFEWLPGNTLGLTSRVPSRTGQIMRVDFAPPPPKGKGRTKYKGYYVYPTITIRIRGEGVK